MDNHRKIQIVGNRSYAVSLPKDWVESNKLKRKDTIFFSKTSDNKLIISVDKESYNKNDSLEISINKIRNLSEFLMFCYVKSIDNLTLTSDKFDYAKVTQIREALNCLEGYEIVSEDEKVIKISFMFKDTNITIPQIIRRMVYLLKLLLDSVIDKNEKGIGQTENSIDRLYHLSKRILLSCSTSSSKRIENQVLNDEDIFFKRDIIKKLEGIGDSICQLSHKPFEKKDVDSIRKLLSLIESTLLTSKDIDETMNSFEKLNNLSTKNIVTLKIFDRAKDLMENMLFIEFNKKFS
ncbi:MAG TPA: AbrB/MazE/SpoVT family DNA-binding domain-containing protein [Allocoleopsis sp.]